MALSDHSHAVGFSMRVSAAGRAFPVLLALLCAVPRVTAADKVPVCEIILDCSLAMKGTGTGRTARIDIAWQALGSFFRTAEEDPAWAGGLPRLRLAGGDPDPANPHSPGRVIDGGIGTSVPPLAGGLLPLSGSLEAAAASIGKRGGRARGFVVLVAAGWEGGQENPYAISGGTASPVVHVIGLAPEPAEARQLRQLAVRTGGIYREAGGPAGLEQALHLLAGSGGIYLAASTTGGEAPPPGSRLTIADRRGLYDRNFDFQVWNERGRVVWVPAGPYDLSLTCSGRAEPFPGPPVSVSQGRLIRRRLDLPERGRLVFEMHPRGPSTRRAGATITILDEAGKPAYRLNGRDEYTVPLYPGRYRVRIRPYPKMTAYGEIHREISIIARVEERIEAVLPPEGRIAFRAGTGETARVRLELRDGTPLWSGLAQGSFSLPEGKYRLKILDADGEVVKSKRMRVRAGELTTLGPY